MIYYSTVKIHITNICNLLWNMILITLISVLTKYIDKNRGVPTLKNIIIKKYNHNKIYKPRRGSENNLYVYSYSTLHFLSYT